MNPASSAAGLTSMAIGFPCHYLQSRPCSPRRSESVRASRAFGSGQVNPSTDVLEAGLHRERAWSRESQRSSSELQKPHRIGVEANVGLTGHRKPFLWTMPGTAISFTAASPFGLGRQDLAPNGGFSRPPPRLSAVFDHFHIIPIKPPACRTVEFGQIIKLNPPLTIVGGAGFLRPTVKGPLNAWLSSVRSPSAVSFQARKRPFRGASRLFLEPLERRNASHADGQFRRRQYHGRRPSRSAWARSGIRRALYHPRRR